METGNQMGPEGFAIVIVDRGFVYAGIVAWEYDWCVIRNALNIRRWGTRRGLGELALSGPTSLTMLDPCGTVRVPMSHVITIIETEAEPWRKST